MNNSPADILAAIETTLSGLVPDTIRQLKLGVDTDTSAGFPFCRVYLTDFSSAVADTITYERAYAFAVEVVQEITNKAVRDAELDFTAAVEGVLDRLNGTWQLGIGVEKTEIQTSPVKTVEAPAGPVRVAIIRVVVTTLVQNPS